MKPRYEVFKTIIGIVYHYSASVQNRIKYRQDITDIVLKIFKVMISYWSFEKHDPMFFNDQENITKRISYLCDKNSVTIQHCLVVMAFC